MPDNSPAEPDTALDAAFHYPPDPLGQWSFLQPLKNGRLRIDMPYIGVPGAPRDGA